MLHKAWNCKREMPYCFLRSSIIFQGHTVQNITDFDPNWAFPDYRQVAAFKSLRFALFFFLSSWLVENRILSNITKQWIFYSKQTEYENYSILDYCFQRHLYQLRLTLISAWIDNHMPSKMQDYLTFPQIRQTIVDVWKWKRNFIMYDGCN